MNRIGRVAWVALAWPLIGPAQTADSAVAPARMVITAGHFFSHQPRDLTRGELIVTQDFEPLRITGLTPLRGDHGALEMFFLVDNCSSCEADSKFAELHRFIAAQPAATSVGVAYIQEGRLEIAQNPTADHERAVKALNAPTGSKPSNPFVALRQLIENWAPDRARHVVVMISNGIDPATGESLLNPTADAAIEAAQKAGVMVYVIYHPSADYLTTDPSKIYVGQVQLAHIAAETGGEAYVIGFGPLPSLAPFLSDMADHLANQYLLEFLAKPGEKPGTLQEVTVRSEFTDADIMAPSRVLVPASAAKEAVPEIGEQ